MDGRCVPSVRSAAEASPFSWLDGAVVAMLLVFTGRELDRSGCGAVSDEW